jgi:hypothetical protein
MPSSKLAVGDERGMTPPERLEKYQAVDPSSYETESLAFAGVHGAKRIRTR